MGDPHGRNGFEDNRPPVLQRRFHGPPSRTPQVGGAYRDQSSFEPREGVLGPPTQSWSGSKRAIFRAADMSPCQIVSLSSWLHSGHRKMRTSESPPELDVIAIRCISALQRQSGEAVESATTTRSNFDMIPPCQELYVNINGFFKEPLPRSRKPYAALRSHAYTRAGPQHSCNHEPLTLIDLGQRKGCSG